MKIERPTLLVDENKCRENIRRIADKARLNNLVFRPHFKTHQSAAIGEWFREAGVNRITVSSVSMADYFAGAGWLDILIAFPVNILEIEQINMLAAKIDLSLTVESKDTADFLNQNLKNEVRVYLKIDAGYHRTGIQSESREEIQRVIESVQSKSKLKLAGFLTHSGNTYNAGSRDEIKSIHHEAVRKLTELKEIFSNESFTPIVSIGDTPSCCIMIDFTGVDEIRPGNFVFYDVMQYRLGSCSFNDIAVVLACPVVALHPERNEMVIYGGAIHLSKEFTLNQDGAKNYGWVVHLDQKGWSNPIPDSFVSSVSQEHGIIKTTKPVIDQIKIGDLIGILPIHSCLTAHEMKEYLTLEGRRLSVMN